MKETTVNIGKVQRSPTHAKLMMAISLMGASVLAQAAQDAGQDAALAKELQNPVADLITLPLENRLDYDANHKAQYTLNVQPVWPFELSDKLLLVSRTIIPVQYQEATDAQSRDRSGIGDLTQSFFFASKEPLNGWIVGAGPMLRLPTASDSALSGRKWGAGPTAVLLRQDDAWTYGALVSHVWSYAGWGDSALNASSLQPFLSYTTESLLSFGIGTESTYDWTEHQWTVPFDVSISTLVRIGGEPVDFALGWRSYLERPDGGPNWGVKATITFMLPK